MADDSEKTMIRTRRQLLRDAGATGLGLAAGISVPAFARAAATPDHAIRIAPASVELAPDHVIRTTAYNGTAPGPLIRLREGKPVAIAVTNETDVPELVHWHGLFIPPQVDGAMEEGTPMIMPGETASYSFT